MRAAQDAGTERGSPVSSYFLFMGCAADPDPGPMPRPTERSRRHNKDGEIGHAAYIEPLLHPSLGLFGPKMHTPIAGKFSTVLL
jgi:hypothetical protein